MDPKKLHKEIKYTTSRAGGSGGQHVNKVETKVTLRFDVQNSEELTEQQKETLLTQLKNVINKNKEIVLYHDKKRSQLSNKLSVQKKFDALIKKAFKKQKVRKATKPTKQSLEKKKVNKKRRSEIKAGRKKVRDIE